MTKRSPYITTRHHPLVPEIEAVCGRHITSSFRRHFHQTYIFGLVEEGRREIVTSNKKVWVSKGELFVLNPGQVHACRTDRPDGHSYRLLAVRPELLKALASHSGAGIETTPYFTAVRCKDTELSDAFARMYATADDLLSGKPVAEHIQKFIKHLLARGAGRPHTMPFSKRANPSIEKAKNYINQNYAAPLSLEKLAGHIHLSPFHFHREFKVQVGITPHEYQTHRRIGQSQKMLRASDSPADVAAALGFSDQSHFSRVFKKTVGVPPGRYQRSNQHPPV